MKDENMWRRGPFAMVARAKSKTLLTQTHLWMKTFNLSPQSQNISLRWTATTLSLSVKTEVPSSNTSKNVPVRLSVSHPGMEKLIYALIHMKRYSPNWPRSYILQTKAHPARMKRAGKNTLVHIEKISDIRVWGFYSTILTDLNLSSVYTKDRIPVNETYNPSCETARHWNHLRKIAELSTTAGVWSQSVNRLQLFRSAGITASNL